MVNALAGRMRQADVKVKADTSDGVRFVIH